MERAATGLDVDEDPSFQRREWRVQRIGWIGMAALLAAALLGVFSNGPLSETTARDPEGNVEVRYERFVRHLGQASMEATITASSVSDGMVTLFISDRWVRHVQIENISPEPDSMTRTEEGMYYEFSARGDSPSIVKFFYRPDSTGVVEATVRAGDAGGARLWQLMYP